MVKETSEYEITDHDDVSTIKKLIFILPMMLMSHEKWMSWKYKNWKSNVYVIFFFFKLILRNKLLK